MDVMVPILVVLTVIKIIDSVHINIAVILPEDETRIFSLPRALPAIEFAIDYLRNDTTLLEGNTFHLTYRDSSCNSADGMNHAIKLYMASKVDLFLGPVCDYSLAPVARQTKFWNIPLISVGAMADDFTTYHQQDYPLLTRAGPVNFGALADFFLATFNRFSWDKFFIIYDKTGQDVYIEDFCHLVSSAIHYSVNAKAPDITQDYYKIIGPSDLNENHMLSQQVGLQYAGKQMSLTLKTAKNKKPKSKFAKISTNCIFQAKFF